MSMFEITVTRLRDGRTATAQASHRQALVDHVEASARRNGFEVYRDRVESYLLGYEVGDVLKDALANAEPHSSPQLRRVWRAAKALSAYAEIYGEHDLGDMFTDFLADLGHLADAAGVDFADAIEKGTFHLDVEREENE